MPEAASAGPGKRKHTDKVESLKQVKKLKVNEIAGDRKTSKKLDKSKDIGFENTNRSLKINDNKKTQKNRKHRKEVKFDKKYKTVGEKVNSTPIETVKIRKLETGETFSTRENKPVKFGQKSVSSESRKMKDTRLKKKVHRLQMKQQMKLASSVSSNVQQGQVSNQHKAAKKKMKKKSPVPAAVVNANEEAIKYLESWKQDKSNWKFQKVRQVWLLKNMFSPDKVSAEHFALLLEYLEPMVGRAKESCLKDAQSLLDAYERDSEIGTFSEKPTDEQYRRSRETIQLLS